MAEIAAVRAARQAAKEAAAAAQAEAAAAAAAAAAPPAAPSAMDLDGREATRKKLASFTAPKQFLDEVAVADVDDDTLPEVRAGAWARREVTRPAAAAAAPCWHGVAP